MNDQYAVFGNPIVHSRSPQIHRLFAEQSQQKLIYQAQLVGIDDFAIAADQFFDHAGRGLNVTVPFKQDAFDYAHEVSARAAKAGAVNTLIKREDGSIFGDTS